MAQADAAARPIHWAAAAKPSKSKKKPKTPPKNRGTSKKPPRKPPVKSSAASRSKTSAKVSAASPLAPPAPPPIDLYYWPTPNGWKIAIMLEECGLAYRIKPVNIGRGDQFEPSFLALSPNNRIPAIVDHEGPDGKTLSVFESGAILQYLGRKTGKFYPGDERRRVAVDEWLFWQVGGLGPMAGQAAHFRQYQPQNAYALKRYTDEVHRLLGVMNRRLASREYLADDYSIADMACLGWVLAVSRIPDMLSDFPNVLAWLERLRARPAVQKGLEVGRELRAAFANDAQARALARNVLFGQRGS